MKTVIAIVLFSVVSQAMAGVRISPINQNNAQSIQNQSISSFDELNADRFASMGSKEKAAYARQWGMSVDDFKHYLYVKANTPTGALYAHAQLDPNLLLALHAYNHRQVQEAQIYVTQAVKNEHDQIESLLKVQNMYQKTAQRLFPGETPIQLKGKKPASYISYGNTFGVSLPGQVIVPHAKYVLLVRASSPNKAKRHELHQAINNILYQDGTRIDIYDLDLSQAQTLFDWAASMGISPEVVDSKRVTLNESKQFVSDIQKRMGANFIADTLLRDVHGHYKVISLSEAAK